MSVRSFIRRWLVCGLCSGSGQAHNPHLAATQAINALVSSLGIDRAEMMGRPGKLAILVVAYQEVTERDWDGQGRRDFDAFWTTPEAQGCEADEAWRADAQGAGGCEYFSPRPRRERAASPQCCGIAA